MAKQRRKKKLAKKKRKQKPKRAKKPKTRDQQAVLKKLQQSVAAWLLGMSDRTLRDAMDAPRLQDGTYDGRSIVAWYAARERANRAAEASKSLERIREAKAAAAERQNLLEEGQLIKKEDVMRAMAEISAVMHTKLETLIRLHGGAVGDAIQEMIKDASAEWESRFSAEAVHAAK